MGQPWVTIYVHRSGKHVYVIYDVSLKKINQSYIYNPFSFEGGILLYKTELYLKNKVVSVHYPGLGRK